MEFKSQFKRMTEEEEAAGNVKEETTVLTRPPTLRALSLPPVCNEMHFRRPSKLRDKRVLTYVRHGTFKAHFVSWPCDQEHLDQKRLLLKMFHL